MLQSETIGNPFAGLDVGNEPNNAAQYVTLKPPLVDNPYQLERARAARIQADILELKLQERLGELVSRKVVKDTWEAIARMINQSMLGIGKQVAPEVVGIADVGVIAELIESRIRSELRDLTQVE